MNNTNIILILYYASGVRLRDKSTGLCNRPIDFLKISGHEGTRDKCREKKFSITRKYYYLQAMLIFFFIWFYHFFLSFFFFFLIFFLFAKYFSITLKNKKFKKKKIHSSYLWYVTINYFKILLLFSCIFFFSFVFLHKENYFKACFSCLLRQILFEKQRKFYWPKFMTLYLVQYNTVSWTL